MNRAHVAKPTKNANRQRRAIGIVRVSQTKGREGERFVSPEEQRERIEAACKRDDLRLLTVHDELDVSGGKALDQRPGLSAAVAAIEAGEAEVVAAAYFDRLFRALSTQAEVIERVETAGGQVLAVDVGQLTNGSAGQWLSGTMMGAVSEYFRRSIAERSADGQARAVARGATPWARVPVGYARRNDGTLAPDPKQVLIARKAFEMRDEGASIPKIRAMLKSHGIVRSQRGVQIMLASRVYLGELHFGELVNLQAHDPIIDRELWNRVQRMVIPRGRQASSTRLLARLGVLRCGSCGGRLSTMKLPKQHDYPIYRCPSTSECDSHVTISAEIAEDVVTSAVREAWADVQGRASVESRVRDAEAALDQAQKALDRAFRTLADFTDEPETKDTLDSLRTRRDAAEAHLAQLGGSSADMRVTVADWDKLTLEERRALIRATVKRAVVAPSGGRIGRKGPDRVKRARERITVELL